jgi:PleD family two-component response regulator
MEMNMPLMMDSPAIGKSRGEDARAALSRGVEHRGDNVVALNPPREADRQVVIDWAAATIAQAEERVAVLQARIEYLEGLSVTDELTGLLNRRGFLAQLDRALAAARRGGPHGVLMIYRFTFAINDLATILSARRALPDTSRRPQSGAPTPYARLGGDEFAILSGAICRRAANAGPGPDRRHDRGQRRQPTVRSASRPRRPSEAES